MDRGCMSTTDPLDRITGARETQFAYFDEVLGHPQWTGRKILDFGGNFGNFLRRARGVDQADYWCMEVHEPILKHGRAEFPRAHFVHYNRYSAEYNPSGIRNLPVPDCGVAFDFILAFSVFTHMHRIEVIEFIAALRGMLAPDGIFAFTFTDHRYDRSLSDPRLPAGSDVRKNLLREGKHPPSIIDTLVERAQSASWCVALDGELYLEPGPELCGQNRSGRPWESYCSYFTTETMQSLVPDGILHAPVQPDWQHCCVVRNR
jgi:SAM-dependent methyltransferase